MIEKNYPFTAIVGQDEMKLALILNLINPKLNGVLIKGEKGTAKSTAVRSLAEVCPKRLEIENCAFSCDPNDSSFWCEDCRKTYKNNKNVPIMEGQMKVVNLPVSSTEDRVVGTLDIEHALKFGEKKFEKGVLAEANRNILYVDEINLLDDHVVDVLLDSAAMGVNMIEREGVSYSHPARFVLVGTMNPEEGDLRPQLLDRFGLVVNVSAEPNIEKRVEIVKNRLEFESNPDSFCAKYVEKERALSNKIENAKIGLSKVTYDNIILKIIAEVCVKLDVDGHRADITMLKTAITNAAFEGRKKVEKSDLIIASKFVLPHRMRKNPFEDMQFDLSKTAEFIENYGN